MYVLLINFIKKLFVKVNNIKKQIYEFLKLYIIMEKFINLYIKKFCNMNRNNNDRKQLHYIFINIEDLIIFNI